VSVDKGKSLFIVHGFLIHYVFLALEEYLASVSAETLYSTI
jgi:hypothetical protein